MSDNPKELSSRFFSAAKTTLCFSFVLLIPDAIGCIKFLSIDFSALPSTIAIKTVALLLFPLMAWSLFEWSASSENAQDLPSNRIRIFVVIAIGVGSLLVTYPRIVEHTRFETVSRLWFLAYPIIGHILGGVVGTMVLASKTIRSKEEAIIKRLHRIPLPTADVYIGGVLGSALLLVIYYICLANTPHELSILPATIVVFFFICGLSGFLVLLLPVNNFEQCLVKETSPFMDGLKKANDFYDSYIWWHENNSDPKKKKETENGVFMLRVMQMSHSPDDVQIKFHVPPLEFSFNIDSTDIGALVTVAVVSDDITYPGRFNISVYTGRFAHFVRKYLTLHPKGLNKDNELEFYTYFTNQAVLETIKTFKYERFYDTAVIGDISSAKKILADSGVDINKTYELHRTALMQAVQYGLVEMVSFLLENGADPSIPNVNNATPLSYGAMTNRIKICKLLIKYGAQEDVNKQDFFGMTPIMYAAQHGYNEVVKILMTHGADPNIKSKFGKSALDIARRFHHGDTAKILIGKRPRVS